MATLKLLPVALLLAAGAWPVSPANAQGVIHFKVAVTYDPADPAEKIYADIKGAARHACMVDGKRPLSLHKYQLACERRIIDESVAKIGRADVAAIHKGGSFAKAGTDLRG